MPVFIGFQYENGLILWLSQLTLFLETLEHMMHRLIELYRFSHESLSCNYRNLARLTFRHKKNGFNRLKFFSTKWPNSCSHGAQGVFYNRIRDWIHKLTVVTIDNSLWISVCLFLVQSTHFELIHWLIRESYFVAWLKSYSSKTYFYDPLDVKFVYECCFHFKLFSKTNHMLVDDLIRRIDVSEMIIRVSISFAHFMPIYVTDL